MARLKNSYINVDILFADEFCKDRLNWSYDLREEIDILQNPIEHNVKIYKSDDLKPIKYICFIGLPFKCRSAIISHTAIGQGIYS